ADTADCRLEGRNFLDYSAVLHLEIIADTADVDFRRVGGDRVALGVVLEVRLGVSEQLWNLDGKGLKGDLLAIAEAEVDRGPGAGDLSSPRLEAAPFTDNLVEPALPVGGIDVDLIARTILLDSFLPRGRSLGILAAVLVFIRDEVASL